jgi:myo-inositol-1(or 4)-monophosphatase
VLSIAEGAASVALRARAELKVDGKPDGSVVTNADREAEAYVRAHVGALSPGAAFWGEEGGFPAEVGTDAWLVDPIDGTTNFTYGQPLWGTSVGLMQSGKLELGAVVLPELGLRLCARRGHGAWCGGEAMGPVPQAAILAHEPVGREDGCAVLASGKGRHLGSFVVEAAFTALGWMRGFCSHRAKLYDAAGSLVVLREVGAEARHADGRELDESAWLCCRPIEPFAVYAAGLRLPERPRDVG